MKKTKTIKLVEAEVNRKAKQSYCKQRPNACWQYIKNPVGF